MVVDVRYWNLLIFTHKSLIFSFSQTDFTWNKGGKVYKSKYSQAVTHPSTNFAQRDLTSVISRKPVFSWWYGRRRKILEAAHFYSQIFNFRFFLNRFIAAYENGKSTTRSTPRRSPIQVLNTPNLT